MEKTQVKPQIRTLLRELVKFDQENNLTAAYVIKEGKAKVLDFNHSQEELKEFLDICADDINLFSQAVFSTKDRKEYIISYKNAMVREQPLVFLYKSSNDSVTTESKFSNEKLDWKWYVDNILRYEQLRNVPVSELVSQLHEKYEKALDPITKVITFLKKMEEKQYNWCYKELTGKS